MADEKTVALDCDQYEDLKEAVVKTIKAECAGGGNADNGQIMQKIADQYDEDIDVRMAGMIAAIEPTLVIILSVIVGIILLSVMLPLVSIMAGL